MLSCWIHNIIQTKFYSQALTLPNYLLKMLSRAAQKQSYSRSIRHGNLMNKRGVADHYQRATPTNTKVNKVHKVARIDHSASKLIMQRHFGDLIVHAHAPKPEIMLCSETRYTIPLSPKNNNIYEEEMFRSQELFQDVLCEMKSEFKVHAFAVDQEHEIEVIV